jgi:hypothetical protein
MTDEPMDEVPSQRTPKRDRPPRLRVLRWLAVASFSVFAMYFLLDSEPVRKFALVGMIAALLAVIFTYVVRIDGGDHLDR